MGSSEENVWVAILMDVQVVAQHSVPGAAQGPGSAIAAAAARVKGHQHRTRHMNVLDHRHALGV